MMSAEGEAPREAAGTLEVPEHRRGTLEEVLERLRGARSIVMTTHVNADGDGCGSEAAIGEWLTRRGKRVSIVNPTTYPAEFDYLLPGGRRGGGQEGESEGESEERVLEPGTPAAERALDAMDLLLVLDTGEPGRLGRLGKWLGTAPVVVLDHHPPGDEPIAAVGLFDPTAAATGELIYDLLVTALESGMPVEWSREMVEGIYTALVMDTGSFRYANTTPRVHRIAGEMIARGVDPESIYRRIFSNSSLEGLELLRAGLEGLRADPELPLTWVSLPYSAARGVAAASQYFDALTEHARSVSGTEVAVLFREVADGSTKVSLRSNGAADVNALARGFGGGGHVKAAGAVIGAPLPEARERVLEAVREELRRLSSP